MTTITINDKTRAKIISGIMDNFPEASSGNSLYCTAFTYKPARFQFTDQETGKE